MAVILKPKYHLSLPKFKIEDGESDLITVTDSPGEEIDETFHYDDMVAFDWTNRIVFNFYDKPIHLNALISGPIRFPRSIIAMEGGGQNEFVLDDGEMEAALPDNYLSIMGVGLPNVDSHLGSYGGWAALFPINDVSDETIRIDFHKDADPTHTRVVSTYHLFPKMVVETGKKIGGDALYILYLTSAFYYVDDQSARSTGGIQSNYMDWAELFDDRKEACENIAAEFNRFKFILVNCLVEPTGGDAFTSAIYTGESAHAEDLATALDGEYITAPGEDPEEHLSANLEDWVTEFYGDLE